MTIAEQRADAAQRILDEPLFREAFNTVEANIVAKLAMPNSAPEAVQSLHQQLVALHRVRRHLEQVIVTGRMEEMAEATNSKGKRK